MEIGQKIFEYEIIRPLGQGGFATVFEAHDRFLGRKVAIKQPLLDKTGDKNAIKRFVQEARIIAALEHPNIVTILGLRLKDNQFFIVMEYIAGGSLRDLLDKQGRLSIEQAVQLTIGICEGLAKLHEHGIFHRDIKIENILLTTDGRPKLIDFGIAHVPEEMGGLGLTQAGFQPSTLLYSSPEQVRGEQLDARSDVYQIGSLLYYMLAGKHYIDLETLETLAITTAGDNQFRSQAKLYELLEIAICDEMPSGLRALEQEFGEVIWVLTKALSKNKTDRFEDASEFSTALKSLKIV